MAYGISFGVSSAWDAGFVGSIAVTNSNPTPTNGWIVEFDAPFQITSLWNGDIVSHVGNHYVVRNAGWNGAIAANGSASFGFQAAKSAGPVPVPTAYLVNGQTPGASGPEPLPTLAIGDVAVVEGQAGTKVAELTVSLSKVSAETVTVAYATANDSASAGSDYVATSGTLTFAPGETAKTIRVTVNGDVAVEATETFKLNLSNASGATLSKAQAVATITNDDVAAARPAISVGDVSVNEGNPVAIPGGGGGTGYFHTQGNQIVDSAGNPVKIAGVNWFGMESNRYAPDGLHARNYKDMMDQMADLGFNAIRLPFSNQLFDAGSTPNGIDYGRNPDLAGLSGLQVMDKIVAYAGEVGLRIILDHHRSSAGAGASENGLWYNASYSEQRFVGDWVSLANRYKGNPTVIGADLHNEPHEGTWGGGGAVDWAAAAERAGNAVLAANPNWLVFVEGVEAYQNQYYWWGGNLMGVKDRPIVLNVANQLVYSAHDYPNSIYGQPWFYEGSFPDNLPAKFDQMWGYIYKQNIAPVLLGEFGSRLSDPKDIAWLDKLQPYLSGDFDANGTRDIPAGKEGISWTWWSWNPNSGDTGGILQDDWTTVIAGKVSKLQPIMFDLDPAGSGGGTANGVTEAQFTIALSSASAEAVTVAFRTMPGTAAGDDFTSVSGTVTFAPGETSKVVKVPVVGDANAEANETVELVLSAPVNASLADATGILTILNDDGALVLPPSQAPQPPGGAAQLTAAETIVDDWGSGSVLSVSVRNTGASAVDSWTVSLDSSIQISNIWNAELVSHTGDHYVIRSTAWNKDLAPGAETSFGFQTSGSAAGAALDWDF